MQNHQTLDTALNVPNVIPSAEPPAYSRRHFGIERDAPRGAERRKVSSAIVASVESKDTDVVFDPLREPVLDRGLQIPCRATDVATGFAQPEVLEQAGISEHEWKAFTHEIKHHAGLRGSQWLCVFGASLGFGLVLGCLGILPAVVVCTTLHRQWGHQNFMLASRNGSLAMCAERWNERAFLRKGLMVRIETPGQYEDMRTMDLSTSKLYRYQQKTGSPSPAAGAIEPLALGTKEAKKVLRYQRDEGHARTKAALKPRIVIVPTDPKDLAA